jgi:hypothetical protein
MGDRMLGACVQAYLICASGRLEKIGSGEPTTLSWLAPNLSVLALPRLTLLAL